MANAATKFIVTMAKTIAVTMATLIVTIVVALIGLPLLVLAAALELIDYFKGNGSKSEDGDCRDLRDEAAAEDSASTGN